jgi:hypothetical protein
LLEVIGNQYLALKNVICGTYTVYSNETALAIKNFYKNIEKFSVTATGELVYSILSDLEEEPLLIRFYLPVKEDLVEFSTEDNNFMFQSYFLIRNTLKIRYEIDSENVDKAITSSKELTQIAYAELIKYSVENDLEILTNFYHTQKLVNNKWYEEISVGIK